MSPPDEPGVGGAWGWVDHLRSGGTTSWLSWIGVGEGSATPPGEGASATAVGSLPGARQLELLRRLNEAGAPSTRLAARVLSAPTSGRGATELPLVGAQRSGFGPQPVDPAALSAEDLLRVVLPLVVEELSARDRADLSEPAPLGPSSRGLRPGRRFRLVGDPGLAEPLRETLRAMGRPPGGPRATVFVLGVSLDRMLSHAWAERCFAGGAPAWPEWLARHQAGDSLPRRIDLAAVAEHWVAEVGSRRVAVVLDPGALGPLLGVGSPVPEPREASAGAAELARRLGPPLRLRLPDDRRRAVLRGVLRPALAPETGAQPAIPAERRDWVDGRAAAMRAALEQAGYAVHGGVDAVLPVDRPHAAAESYDAQALSAGIRLLLRFDRDVARSGEEDA